MLDGNFLIAVSYLFWGWVQHLLFSTHRGTSFLEIRFIDSFKKFPYRFTTYLQHANADRIMPVHFVWFKI